MNIDAAFGEVTKKRRGRPPKAQAIGMDVPVTPATNLVSVEPKKEKTFAPTYKTINVELELVGRMYGGLPQGKEQLLKWIEAKGEIPEETVTDKLAITPALTPEEMTEKIEMSSTVFRADDQGLFIRDFMIKQMLKECATVLGLTQRKIGSKNILTIGLVVEPERIRPVCTRATGEEVQMQLAAGWEEFQGKVKTMQGPRNILSRKAYIEPGTRFRFEVCFLETDKVTVDDLAVLFKHAGKFVGLGSARSREAGKFKVNKFEVA